MKVEEEKIKTALGHCGYPKWTMDKVKQQMATKSKKKDVTKKNTEEKAKGMVVIPYVEGLSENSKESSGNIKSPPRCDHTTL